MLNKRENSPSDMFMQLLTTHQMHLRSFILAAVGNYTYCDDVLQQTNLVLWKKAGEFRPDEPFLPWALAVARYEILAFYRDRQRERLIFRQNVAELMVETSLPEIEDVTERQHALRQCIKKLPELQQEMLKLRYVVNAPTSEISRVTKRSRDGVKSLLLRIRKALKKCIETRLECQTGVIADES